MERLESEYPTNEQIEEMFMAWEKDGEAGISEVLRKRRRERKESEATGPVRATGKRSMLDSQDRKHRSDGPNHLAGLCVYFGELISQDD